MKLKSDGNFESCPRGAKKRFDPFAASSPEPLCHRRPVSGIFSIHSEKGRQCEGLLSMVRRFKHAYEVAVASMTLSGPPQLLVNQSV